MDLNPREAVVDQKPSHTLEQEEAPIHALLVPERLWEAVMDSLNRLAADRGEPVCAVYGTNCITTSKPKPLHLDCGD